MPVELGQVGGHRFGHRKDGTRGVRVARVRQVVEPMAVETLVYGLEQGLPMLPRPVCEQLVGGVIETQDVGQTGMVQLRMRNRSVPSPGRSLG